MYNARTEELYQRPSKFGRVYIGGLPCFDPTVFDNLPPREGLEKKVTEGKNEKNLHNLNFNVTRNSSRM